MIILGIESSCDETAAALVTGDRQVLAHRLLGQEAAHAPFGGVVPEIAARAHVEALEPLIVAALADAGLKLADVDAIAATAGPGLIGGVMVGLVTGILSDTVMSQVELQCGPHRIVSLMSTEAVRDLKLEIGSLAVAVVKATMVVVEAPKDNS